VFLATRGLCLDEWSAKPEKARKSERLGGGRRPSSRTSASIRALVSLDELAIGFSVGLLGSSIGVAVVLIALQAFIVPQMGVRLGSKVGEEIREGAERLAGLALVVLGAFIVGARLIG